MNFINTDDLKLGMVFSEPVYTEGDNLLIPKNFPLRKRDIDILKTCGIDFVISEGTTIDIDDVKNASFSVETSDETSEIFTVNEEPQEIPEPPKPPKQEAAPSNMANIKFSISDVSQNSGSYRAYKNLIEKLNKAFADLKTSSDVQMRTIDNICILLLQDLRDYPDNYIDFILGGEITTNELAKSSVNTAILSALTAQELKLPNHKISKIVAGALIHDVGMLRLSKGITEKKGGLSEAELEQIKSHPLHTSKIVTKELFGPHEVNLIALQHHERWDGQGYPDKLSGNAIDIGARIVSVADAFEAMVSKKSYRNSMGGYQAIKNLLADNGRRFDPAVIIAFTKVVGIYPIGSIVRLNNKALARVIKVNAEAPLRPVVQILMDEKGNVPSSKNAPPVDLLIQKTLFIKEAIDPAEYSKQNE